MDLLRLLEWDTSFFGFPVARVVNSKAQPDELREVVSQMQSRQIRLAYWFADHPSPESQAEVLALGGALVDEKLTFVTSLMDWQLQQVASVPVIEPFHEGMPLSDLKQLGVDSGLHSRFFVDPKFPRASARAMFEEWIVRSVNKSAADEVLVIRQGTDIVGMVTIGRAGDRANIGLLAVAERCRGQQFGQALVYAAQKWGHDRGFTQMQVVTQQANVAARRLYIKCGFELEKQEACYHIWSTLRVLPS